MATPLCAKSFEKFELTTWTEQAPGYPGQRYRDSLMFDPLALVSIGALLPAPR